MKANIKVIRGVLDELARVESADSDTKEIVYDRELAKIRNLDQDGILEAVSEAVGTNSKRKQYSPHVFAELFNTPGIERIFTEMLSTSDENGRSSIIQTIGLHRMRSLVGVLNEHFTRETDDFCRDNVLSALGTIADESSLPIFEYLMQKPGGGDEWRILCAGKNYAIPEFASYMQAVFDAESTKKTHKIMAAWGLAKLGNETAYAYLVSMLDDPATIIKTDSTTAYDPGESIRAAQAISDIHRWEFEWSKSSVGVVKKRLSEI